MPKFGEMFESKYLKAADFDEDGEILTIRRIVEETIGQGKDAAEKWVLYFREREKGLVLNKTNANVIVSLYGDDTDDWIGKQVTLYATEVPFQGDMVEAIRVKKKMPKPPRAPAKASRQPGDDEGEEDPY